jgi:osmotically-inducible protein OsmY
MKAFAFFAAVSAFAMALGLAACNRNDDGRTVGQKVGQTIDQGVAQVDKAAQEVKTTAKQGADEAAEKTKDASQQVSASVSDMAITAAVKAGLAKDKELSALRVNVDTKDGRVSLYGSAPNEGARERATQIAQAEKGVTGVDNKLAIENR